MKDIVKKLVESWSHKDGIFSIDQILEWIKEKINHCDYIPTITITKGNERKDISLEKDDSFQKSIQHFLKCIENDSIRKENYQNLLEQEKILSEFMEEK